MKRRPISERFWEKVNKTTPDACWMWNASHCAATGYGMFSIEKGDVRTAHRVAYELSVGPVPKGLQLDHLCRVRLCVNPSHLEAVTSRENTMRGANVAAQRAAQTHCLRDHPLSGENLYIHPQRGTRGCKECAREGARRRAAA